MINLNYRGLTPGVLQYSCSSAHHLDRSLLRPDSSGPSVQAYSRPSFTALGPSAWTFRSTFTACHWLSRRILRLHIINQEIHQSTQYCQPLIIQGWPPLVLNLHTLNIKQTQIEKQRPQGIVKIKKLLHLLANRFADEKQSEFRYFIAVEAPKRLLNLEEQ